MKKLAVVASDKKFANFLLENVQKYMGHYGEIYVYTIDEIEKKDHIEEDFVLLSAFTIYQRVRQKIGSGTEIIILNLSLSKKQIDVLRTIPEGTRALLVNFDNRSCLHTIQCIYDAGIGGLELYPYYGSGDYDRTIKVAITPDEAHLIPEGIETVYDIGQSAIDMGSFYNLADKLGVYEEFSANEANEAKKEYYNLNSSMDRLLNDNENLFDKLEALLRLMNEGIIIVDSVGRIYLTNDKANKLLSERSKVLVGFNIVEVLPELNVHSTKEKLIKTPSANLIASSVEIQSGKEMAGYIITIADFEEEEEKQHGMRAKLSETNHKARYHFEDILGESKLVSETVSNAKQLATSDAAVMITGESGTGKEMFAQGIHNGSKRRTYNFVAVNCAAIPDNLLESEMFGYEEGAFSGARKGGKMGFFELAHKGTIFLDEIGELPLQLQSKLLRVIEERKVIRVGGSRNIDIDVRIISATNKNLYSMVEKGAFREDLYYRLNVLPLSIPPLRDRKEDIIPIFNALIGSMNSQMQLSPEAQSILENYTWRGNVRELRNVAEFLASKNKKYIEKQDLPLSQFKQPAETQSELMEGMKSSTLIDKFILREGREIELYYMILHQLKESLSLGQRYGRLKLMEKINERGAVYTEGEIRKGLLKLSSYGFIRSAKGRGGSVINSEGMQLLSVIENFRERGILG